MADGTHPSRRNFIKQASLLGAAGIVAPRLVGAESLPVIGDADEGNGFVFLYQGDSITDGNRSRQDMYHLLGDSYVHLIASRLLYDHPGKDFHFFNRGINGNKITDLADRWQEDTIALKPNFISVLIGVNDVQSALGGNASATSTAFGDNYRALLNQTRAQLPGVEFMICEPFILPVGKVKDNWEPFQKEIKGRQIVTQIIANEFNAIFLPLQDVFNDALNKAPADYWIWDGIHPTPAGQEMIAREWIKHVSRKLKFIK